MHMLVHLIVSHISLRLWLFFLFCRLHYLYWIRLQVHRFFLLTTQICRNPQWIFHFGYCTRIFISRIFIWFFYIISLYWYSLSDETLSSSLLLRFFLSFFFWPCHTACGILVPGPGIEPRPWQWKSWVLGTSLVVQWVRLCTLNAGGPASIPDQGTRSHMYAATKSLHATTKGPACLN